MKRSMVLFLLVAVMSVSVMAFPFLPNPPGSLSTVISSNPPAQWIYGSYGNLLGMVSSAGVHSYFKNNMTSPEAPTLTSGFGWTTPASAVVLGYTNSAFSIVVGSATAASGVLTFPPANSSWVCTANDETRPGTIRVAQTADTTTSVTFTSYNAASTVAANMSTSDNIEFQCSAF